MKSLESALTVRGEILRLRGRRAQPDPERREEWLTFAVVGTSPTGVRIAAGVRRGTRDTLRGNSAPRIPAAAGSCSSKFEDWLAR